MRKVYIILNVIYLLGMIGVLFANDVFILRYLAFSGLLFVFADNWSKIKELKGE